MFKLRKYKKISEIEKVMLAWELIKNGVSREDEYPVELWKLIRQMTSSCVSAYQIANEKIEENEKQKLNNTRRFFQLFKKKSKTANT